jgi:hypothetical protein
MMLTEKLQKVDLSYSPLCNYLLRFCHILKYSAYQYSNLTSSISDK